MTNLEKINELVQSSADKEQIVNWAYMNRILVVNLADEPEFEHLKNSVDVFIQKEPYSDDEFENWGRFLDSEFIA